MNERCSTIYRIPKHLQYVFQHTYSRLFYAQNILSSELIEKLLFRFVQIKHLRMFDHSFRLCWNFHGLFIQFILHCNVQFCSISIWYRKDCIIFLRILFLIRKLFLFRKKKWCTYKYVWVCMCMTTKHIYIYIQSVSKFSGETLKGDRGHQKDSDLFRNT